MMVMMIALKKKTFFGDNFAIFFLTSINRLTIKVRDGLIDQLIFDQYWSNMSDLLVLAITIKGTLFLPLEASELRNKALFAK